jgi:hypothetical protein
MGLVAEQLVQALLDGESPKEFFRRRRERERLKAAGPKRYVAPRVHVMDCHDWAEWEDLDDWQRIAAVEFQEIEGESAYDDASTNTLAVDQQGRSWLIFEDENAAEATAVSQVEDDIDNEPGLFTQGFLEGFINTERLKMNLQSDAEDSIRDSQSYEWPDAETKRDGLIQAGKLDEVEFQDEEGNWLEITPELESTIDQAFDDYVSDMAERQVEDPIEYLTDMMGRDEAIKFAMQNAGIDTAEAAAAAVRTDGWQHFLARYDGNSYDLPSGAVYVRTN